jgi:hypothetical protein
VKTSIDMIQDTEGNVYRVPNFCINQPFFEKDIKEGVDVKEIHDKPLRVFIIIKIALSLRSLWK